MNNKKANVFRGVRKAAHITRKLSTKASNFSGRVEQKADRVIHGTDPTIKIHDTILFEKMAAEALSEITPIHPALPLAGRQPYVTLLIPSLQNSSFFGGTATALILAGLLANKKGYRLRIVETLRHGGARTSQLTAFFAANNITVSEDKIVLVDLAARRYNHYGYLDIHPQDIYMASAWWDAHLLDQLPLQSKYIYLIQDYEPIFYNNSDKYVLAERTYKSDRFIPVCNTRLMHTFMASKGYQRIEKEGIWFEPAVAVSAVGNQMSTKGGKKKMFIYGRPSVARNLFYFALTAVDELFADSQLMPTEWEVCMAGQDSLADTVLPSGVKITNLGKMDMQNYYELVQSTDLAISPMMAPHPNYPTLEFASAGAAVVTTKWETKQDLSSYSENIFIADIEKEAFKNAILEASKLSGSKRAENAQKSTIQRDWVAALSKTIETLATKPTNLL